jgi:hypothetical protein
MKMMFKVFRTLLLLNITLILGSCFQSDEATPQLDTSAVFLDFSMSSQTLPTAIKTSERKVKLEVAHATDVTQLVPEFEIPEGYHVFANGVEQQSGVSVMDFSTPASYELRSPSGQTTAWSVSVVPLSCKIIIDASHDGGVWWFPQGKPGTPFDANLPHQGKALADILRSQGFEVTELGRGIELSEEMFFGHYIVIRANGFEPYTAREVEVYSNLLERGMNLFFMTDHKHYDLSDEIGELLGLQFAGFSRGSISTFTEHEITANLDPLWYTGSVLTNVDQNPNITVLGWLGPFDYADFNFNDIQDPNEPTGMPAMGVLSHPHSRVFFIGDTNSIEFQPQPFIDNLISWIGYCNL